MQRDCVYFSGNAKFAKAEFARATLAKATIVEVKSLTNDASILNFIKEIKFQELENASEEKLLKAEGLDLQFKLEFS